jgi:osmotically-inducible protein OsmY
MTTTSHRGDHDLKTMVVDELDFTPAVNADHIGVSVDDGAVILSGDVSSYPEKYAAVRAALRVRGVSAVADEIEVHSPWAAYQDVDIARDANDALQRSTTLLNDAVKATVHDHRVTLTGVLEWKYQRDYAERAVSAIKGVTHVENKISLTPHLVVDAETMKSKITSAIMRNAQLDADNVQVSVTGPKATLRGAVSSWAERRQAEHAAWATAGVTIVNNQIIVRN